MPQRSKSDGFQRQTPAAPEHHAGPSSRSCAKTAKRAASKADSERTAPAPTGKASLRYIILAR
eukprot:8635816-Alexandrium_andersonii.AAC.1